MEVQSFYLTPTAVKKQQCGGKEKGCAGCKKKEAIGDHSIGKKSNPMGVLLPQELQN